MAQSSPPLVLPDGLGTSGLSLLKMTRRKTVLQVDYKDEENVYSAPGAEAGRQQGRVSI